MTQPVDELAEARARLGLPPLVRPEDVPTYEGDDPIEPGQKSDEDVAIDAVLAGVGIVEAYDRWSGKGPVEVGSKTESIMVSCPHPDHPDAHPSAWLNTDKNLGNCAIHDGFDSYTIAGWAKGLDPKTQFRELRRAMAEDFGLVLVKAPSGMVTPMVVDPALMAQPSVVEMPHEDEAPAVVVEPLDWRAILPEGTFLRRYVELTGVGDIPDEYNLACGLMAVSLAAGPTVTLTDNPDVKGNLFSALLGTTGSGKSKSSSLVRKLLASALPYEHSDPNNTGVRLMPVPGSAEILVDMHVRPEYDPGDPKVIVRLHPVRSLVEFPEMSDLIGKSARGGNVLKPTLHQFYDAYGNVTIASRGHGVVEAFAPYCCVLSTTQLRSLGKMLDQSDADSGFLNRWLWWVATPKRLIHLGGPRIDPTELTTDLQRLRAWSGYGRHITLDQAADSLYEQWFQDDLVPSMGDDSPLMSRMNLSMKKIILNLAVNEMQEVANIDLVTRALKFWPYFYEVYTQLGVKLGSSVEFEAAEQIREALAEFRVLDVDPSVRDLWERKLKRRFKDRAMIVKVLSNMVGLQEIIEFSTPTKAGGRPVIRYRLVG